MRRLVVLGLTLALTVAGASRASADEVTDWNEMMLRCAVIAGTSALNMARVAAIVQASVFDAVNGIDKRYTPIRVTDPAPAGASRRAAAVQAAYVVLSKHYGAGGLFVPPSANQQAPLDSKRRASLTALAADEDSAAINVGVAWGQTVADAIWAWRSTDGFNTLPPTFTGSTALGQWRQTPNAPAAGTSTPGVGYPQVSQMTPWAMQTPSQFRPPAPYAPTVAAALASKRYAVDFNETKTMGLNTSALRTGDQTIYALLWAAGSATYLWNNAARSLLDGRNRDRRDMSPRNQNNTLLENARLLAAMDVAMADASIGCWEAKYTYTWWRPITAIRETADDGNPMTTPDPSWAPMFATPAHPEYPSGHSCVSGAATAVLAKEFGNNVPFSITSDVMVGVERSFHGLTEALEEVMNARIFAGIHFRLACEAGTELGRKAAENVLAIMFQRIN
jgi:PAP2 superfamily